MNCAECKELLVGCIEEVLGDSQKREIESHLETCPPCRAELAQISGLRDRLTANGKLLARRNLEDKVIGRILREQSLRLRKANTIDRKIQLWRKIMKNRISRFAVAAAIVAIVALSISYLGQTTSVAYALNQTIKANHTIRQLHIRDFKAGKSEAEQLWLEFDESGQLLSARMDFPQTEDGPKVCVLNEKKAHVWFKGKNFLVTLWDTDEKVAKRLVMTAEDSDPKLMVERLREAEREGRAKLEIAEPSSKSEPITVTATYLRKDGAPAARDVLFVDPRTKLVAKRESYALKDGKYELTRRQEFLNYNKAIDTKMFTIEAPDDAIRVDQTTQIVGLLKGGLSDKEIAVKVAEEFFKALIAEDYACAGKLYEGMPADFMKQQFGKIRFLRIVSTGEPTAHPIPETRFLCVPCQVEIEAKGAKLIKEFVPNIRPVYSDPNYWTIGGGI